MALQSKGNMMCLLIPSGQRLCGKPVHEYGVLMQNMVEESYLGTCLMMDGRYVTLSWDKLKAAFKRVKEDEYVMTQSAQNACRQMYLAAIADVTALELTIADCEREYKVSLAKVRMNRKAASEAKKQEEEEPGARTAPKKKQPPAPKKSTLNEICVGTGVAFFFR